jgi:hypothetical protein
MIFCVFLRNFLLDFYEFFLLADFDPTKITHRTGVYSYAALQYHILICTGIIKKKNKKKKNKQKTNKKQTKKPKN